jgi:hypothetical protein
MRPDHHPQRMRRTDLLLIHLTTKQSLINVLTLRIFDK